MRMMRCKADLEIHVTGTGVREVLWPGLEVNFERELVPGHTIADAIAGREDCFEPIDTSAAAAAEQE
jgi:hypothetical protein